MTDPHFTLNTWEIIKRSYEIYRLNFVQLIGIVIIIKGPVALIISLISEPSSPFQDVVSLFSFPFLDPMVISALTVFIFNSLIDRRLGIISSYAWLVPRLLPLIGTVIIVGTLVSSGFILWLIFSLFFPESAGLISIAAPIIVFVFWCWYAFVPQTVIIEGEGGVGALKRSKHLMSGYFRKVFVLIVGVFLVISFLITTIYLGLWRLEHLIIGSSIVSRGLTNIIFLLLEPLRLSIVPLLYLGLRSEKEGYDTSIMKCEMKGL